MTQKIDPFLQTKWGWSDGENAWGNGMNENLIKFSFLLNRRLDGIVSSISTTPVSDGLAYFLTIDNHVYFSGDGVWYNTPLPKGFELIMKSDESHYEFNGTTLVPSSVSGTVDWADITGKPSTFTPSTHTHVISDVTGLQTALDNKVDVVSGKGLSTEDYSTAEKSKLAGISAGAEANTISSVGVGTASLVSGKVGVDLQIKSLVAGSNISFSQTGDTVTINSSTGGVGVVNSVNGYTGTVVLTNADLGATPTTTTITAGNGLTGGGDLSANRTITLGTPSTISTASTNSSSGTTHTHLLSLSAADIGAVDLTTLNTRLGTSGNLGTLALQNSNSVTISGGTINGTPIGGTTRAVGNFTDIDLNGNLTFTGLGKRFQADFTNAVISNRLHFQTSTLNSTTSFGVIPNGTSQNANILALNSSDANNGAYITMAAGPSSVNINSGVRGTGTVLPININMNGVDAVIIDTNANTNVTGDLNLTGASKRIKSDFTNATPSLKTIFQSSTINGLSNISVMPNGTSVISAFTAYNNSSPDNSSRISLVATGTEMQLRSDRDGTGAYLPLNFYTSAALQLSIATNGVATFTNSIVTSGSVNAPSYLGAGVNVSATANTLVKRDGNGDIYGHSIFASNGFAGDGSTLTSLNASNISSGTLASARLPFTVSTSSSANTVVQRDGSGDIYGNNFTTSGNLNLAGNLNISGSNKTVVWGNNIAVATMSSYISFRDSTAAEVGWIGYGAGNGEIAISNQTRNIRIYSPLILQQNLNSSGTITATGGTSGFYNVSNGDVLTLNSGGTNPTMSFAIAGTIKAYLNWDSTGLHLLDSNANSRLDITTSGASVATQANGNNTTLIANTGFVQTALTTLNASNLTTGTVPTARLPVATTGVYGITLLSTSVVGLSTSIAATEYSATIAYNQGTNAQNTANTAISRLDTQYASPFQLLNNLGSVSGAVTIAAASGTHVKATCTGNITWTFPSVASTSAMAITLELTNGGVGTQTWPSGTLWAGGVQPTWTVSGKDRVVFTKAGTDPWLGALAGKGFA